jgi:hypothetical protein
MASWNNNLGYPSWKGAGAQSRNFKAVNIDAYSISSFNIQTTNLKSYNNYLDYISNINIQTALLTLDNQGLTATPAGLYLNGDLIATPNSISNISQWSRFKAESDVDMANSTIKRVFAISSLYISTSAIRTDSIKANLGFIDTLTGSNSVKYPSARFDKLSNLEIRTSSIYTNTVTSKSIYNTNDINTNSLNATEAYINTIYNFTPNDVFYGNKISGSNLFIQYATNTQSLSTINISSANIITGSVVSQNISNSSNITTDSLNVNNLYASNAQISNDLQVSGDTTLNNLVANGALTLNNNLAMNGNINFPYSVIYSPVFLDGLALFSKDINNLRNLYTEYVRILGGSTGNEVFPPYRKGSFLTVGDSDGVLDQALGSAAQVVINGVDGYIPGESGNLTNALLVRGDAGFDYGYVTFYTGASFYPINAEANAISVYGIANITGATNVLGNLFTGGTFETVGAGVIGGNLNIGGILSVTGATFLNGATGIAGAFKVQGPVIFNDQVGGSNVQFTNYGATVLCNGLRVYNNMINYGNITNTGTALIQSNLVVQGPTVISNSLNVTGSALFSNGMDIYGTFKTYNGAFMTYLNVEQQLIVQYDSFLNNVNIAGTLTINNISPININTSNITASNIILYSNTPVAPQFPSWNSNTLYAIGDRAFYNNSNYIASAISKNNAPEATIPLWQSFTPYIVGNVVNVELVGYYRCIVAYAGGAFPPNGDPTHWTASPSILWSFNSIVSNPNPTHLIGDDQSYVNVGFVSTINTYSKFISSSVGNISSLIVDKANVSTLNVSSLSAYGASVKDILYVNNLQPENIYAGFININSLTSFNNHNIVDVNDVTSKRLYTTNGSISSLTTSTLVGHTIELYGSVYGSKNPSISFIDEGANTSNRIFNAGNNLTYTGNFLTESIQTNSLNVDYIYANNDYIFINSIVDLNNNEIINGYNITTANFKTDNITSYTLGGNVSVDSVLDLLGNDIQNITNLDAQTARLSQSELKTGGYQNGGILFKQLEGDSLFWNVIKPQSNDGVYIQSRSTADGNQVGLGRIYDTSIYTPWANVNSNILMTDYNIQFVDIGTSSNYAIFFDNDHLVYYNTDTFVERAVASDWSAFPATQIVNMGSYNINFTDQATSIEFALNFSNNFLQYTHIGAGSRYVAQDWSYFPADHYLDMSNLDIQNVNEIKCLSNTVSNTFTYNAVIQPIIQTGTVSFSGSSNLVTLPHHYTTSNYTIQVTYNVDPGNNAKPIHTLSKTTSNFYVNGQTGHSAQWATFGN